MKLKTIKRNGKTIIQAQITCSDKVTAGIGKRYNNSADRKREEKAVKELLKKGGKND